VGRERAEGQDVVSGVEQVDNDVVEPCSGELVDHVGELGPGGLPIGLLEDRPDQGGDHRPVALGHPRGEVGHEVGPAPLPGCLGQYLSDSRLDAPVGVGDHEFDPTQPPGHQRAQERRPRRGVLGGDDVEADDDAMSLGVDGGGDDGGHVDHRPPSRTRWVTPSIHR